MWLGWAYWEGEFVEPDLELASQWLERAAASGDPEAEYRLAVFCCATARYDRVLPLLHAAVAKGYAPAAYELGNHHHAGKLVPRAIDRALDAWRRAVALGHIPAEAQIVKVRMRVATPIRKPLLWLLLLPITVRAARQHWIDPNSPKVLGI